VTPDEINCPSGFIFRAFFRSNHCFFAASDEEQQAVTGPTKGRHQLGAILDSQTSGSPGPCIDKTTAIPQTGFHGKRGSREFRPSGAHGRNGGKLALDHGI
jgi:hypothetical protein